MATITSGCSRVALHKSTGGSKFVINFVFYYSIDYMEDHSYVTLTDNWSFNLYLLMV